MVDWVIFRHGAKQRESESKDFLPEDPPLLPGQEEGFLRLAEEILKEVGTPDLIVTSPYLRTRETATLLSKAFPEPPTIVVDPDLGEYLGYLPDPLEIKLSEDTQKHKPPTEFNYTALRKRLASFLERYKDRRVWVVSHRIPLMELSRLIIGGKQTPLQEGDAQHLVL